MEEGLSAERRVEDEEGLSDEEKGKEEEEEEEEELCNGLQLSGPSSAKLASSAKRAERCMLVLVPPVSTSLWLELPQPSPRPLRPPLLLALPRPAALLLALPRPAALLVSMLCPRPCRLAHLPAPAPRTFAPCRPARCPAAPAHPPAPGHCAHSARPALCAGRSALGPAALLILPPLLIALARLALCASLPRVLSCFSLVRFQAGVQTDWTGRSACRGERTQGAGRPRDLNVRLVSQATSAAPPGLTR